MEAWRVEVAVRPNLPDPAGKAAGAALRGAGLELQGKVRSKRGYLLGAELDRSQVEQFARDVLVDPVQEQFEILAPGEVVPPHTPRLSVLPLPGVTDPVAGSVQKAVVDSGLPSVAAGTYRAFEFDPANPAEGLWTTANECLANPAIQRVVADRVPLQLPGPGSQPDLDVQAIPLAGLDGDALVSVSVDGGLALDETEMRAIQDHFAASGRAPTRMELETLAQTWSEHCIHKTLTGKIRYGDQIIDNLMKTAIFQVTKTLDRDFCVSVFKDNAGVITFDDEDCVCIKVETHNHPSAIEPFGGAGTGVGGVIRDIMGTGLGAKPVASTDVFCFAPPNMPKDEVPAGCLPPQRVLEGVVSGVRDYGNPMGIPTVNGAVHFDEDFVGNPLVYVGNIGIMPKDKVEKQPNPGDSILVIGGRTGRDGIHGATFSSLELHTESETVSSGAVQIGDPITERKAMDAVLRIRDENLVSAVTDCGAGGFSSAVGEMAEGLGAEVELSDAPLKYEGLAPWEIWISEAQERMVLAIPAEHVARALEICEEEDSEAVTIGTFNDTGRLVIRYQGTVHADLDLAFMHDGIPAWERQATYTPAQLADPELAAETDCRQALLAVLSDFNVASKEWIIRQYDHEVQANSAGKPLVGVCEDGPADAAVLAPKLGSNRGVVLSNGLIPRYSKIDPAAMAECALDEAMRNLVAAGGDPEYTAILDNYCWGNCRKPEQLGGLVHASFALRDLALAYHTPFVSGKDSLNNEFNVGDRTIAIPGCILVSAMSVIPDVRRTMTTDLKRAGNQLVLVGRTRRELGGSVYWKTRGELGACVPRVDASYGKSILDGVYRAIQSKSVTAAHDLSEGGLGVTVAEMCIGGRLGADIDLDAVITDGVQRAEEILFSESQSRFLLEVPADRMADLEVNLHGLDFSTIGSVTEVDRLCVSQGGATVLSAEVDDLVHAFKHPLDLDGTMTQQGDR
ncbi:MAG: phosphoribosylformylglycinamidine synthase subunit PurL [Planctomycetota bacterium]|nr:phosphoribosylformylglycinamidine synthase subunit PurL [Planctomycetota bacterium]